VLVAWRWCGPVSLCLAPSQGPGPAQLPETQLSIMTLKQGSTQNLSCHKEVSVLVCFGAAQVPVQFQLQVPWSRRVTSELRVSTLVSLKD
jgi:hypothetical protein